LKRAQFGSVGSAETKLFDAIAIASCASSRVRSHVSVVASALAAFAALPPASPAGLSPLSLEPQPTRSAPITHDFHMAAGQCGSRATLREP